MPIKFNNNKIKITKNKLHSLIKSLEGQFSLFDLYERVYKDENTPLSRALKKALYPLARLFENNLSAESSEPAEPVEPTPPAESLEPVEPAEPLITTKSGEAVGARSYDEEVKAYINYRSTNKNMLMKDIEEKYKNSASATLLLILKAAEKIWGIQTPEKEFRNLESYPSNEAAADEIIKLFHKNGKTITPKNAKNIARIIRPFPTRASPTDDTEDARKNAYIHLELYGLFIASYIFNKEKTISAVTERSRISKILHDLGYPQYKTITGALAITDKLCK